MSDLKNLIFGKWKVLESAGKRGKHKIWKCICDCGIIKEVHETNLVTGKTISCGCHRVEIGKKNYSLIKDKHRKHLDANTATAAQVWRQAYRDGCSFEDFLKLSQLPCHYCGALPSNKTKIHKNDTLSEEWKSGTFIYNGLDRIDNSKNHALDNVVTCCKNCNYAKRHRSYDEYLEWIEKSYECLISNKRFDSK